MRSRCLPPASAPLNALDELLAELVLGRAGPVPDMAEPIALSAVSTLHDFATKLMNNAGYKPSSPWTEQPVLCVVA